MRKNSILYLSVILNLVVYWISSSHASGSISDGRLETYGTEAISSIKQRQTESRGALSGALYNNTYEDVEYSRRQKYGSDGKVTEQQWTGRYTTRSSSFCTYKSILLITTITGVALYFYLKNANQVTELNFGTNG